jgi:uncharacterized membrane protein YkvA (DUF1232 family)
VLAHDALQRPPQTRPGEHRPRLGRLRGVLAPHVPSPGAPVAADPDLQGRGAPPDRLVSQPADHGVTRGAFASAAAAPLVRLHDPARQDSSAGLEALPHDVEAELVQTSERGQVRARGGSARHVEVFRMGGVGTPIFGRPRPLLGQRRAAQGGGMGVRAVPSWWSSTWPVLMGVLGGLLLLWLVLLVVLWRAAPDRTRLRDALRLLPDTVRLIKRLPGDRSLPRGVRVRLLFLLAYLALPFDLVPDFIPVLGYADDAVVVVLVLRSAARSAGPQALERHWPGTPEGLTAVRRLVGI